MILISPYHGMPGIGTRLLRPQRMACSATPKVAEEGLRRLPWHEGDRPAGEAA